MLIHELTEYINEHKDDNIKVVVKQHPLSGVENSQVLLTFKQQKVKISLAQFSPEGYMYLCIIAKKPRVGYRREANSQEARITGLKFIAVHFAKVYNNYIH